ncbi:MAG: hypothetical protein EZS28_001762 [Streblomastix strix]|uniref:Uncharacterized protein n=1 Tax=Streblomastix strix TaxID=222440 RepID=A0A5J4X674_9EUKA|nr:MAG: hypothetical protein EZS28_001762 [Streblomastix strix]
MDHHLQQGELTSLLHMGSLNWAQTFFDAFHPDPTGTLFASGSARLILIISPSSLRWPLHPRLFLKGGQRSCEGWERSARLITGGDPQPSLLSDYVLIVCYSV